MSYEYKDYIIDEIQHYSGSEEQINELNEVYRKAEAFDEIRADSKMDIYDFELGEYVLKTIKVYESEAD